MELLLLSLFRKTTLQLTFFTKADYQLFKDSGMDTWSWLKNQ